MARTTHTTPEPVILDGYQAVMKPGKFGYKLGAILTEELVGKLDSERADCLNWAESELKNPKRSTLKPEPWEEVDTGRYKYASVGT